VSHETLMLVATKLVAIWDPEDKVYSRTMGILIILWGIFKYHCNVEAN